MNYFVKRMKELETKSNKTLDEYVELEVVTSFEVGEFLSIGSFEKFFNEVDIQNAYEEEWPERLDQGIREIYFRVFLKLIEDLRELT